MIERIRSLIKSKNLNAAQFADQIGVQRSSISHVLSGRNKPSLEFIQKILKAYPEISSDWLINGSGGMNQKMEKTSLFDTSEKDEESLPNISKMRPEQIKNDVHLPKSEIQITSADGKSIERVVIFYKDGKFKEYTPE